MTQDENYKMFLLQDYREKRISGRAVLIKFFLKQIKENLEDRETFIPEKNDLDFNTKIALLQISIISHLMMFLEDLAVFSISFLKGEQNYYQLLDGKDEKDLGKIISEFYEKTDILTNDDVRKILGVTHPEKYQFNSPEEKNLYIYALDKMITVLKTFLVKASVFRESHIGVFRRYKHATLPIFLGIDIPNNDSFHKKFDFVSYAIISENDPSKKLSNIPYTDDVLESYENLMTETYLVLSTIISYHLIIQQRKIQGVIPTPYDYFNKFLKTNEKLEFEKIYKEFQKNFLTDQRPYHSSIAPQEETPPWYTHLDLYKKSNLDIIKEKFPNIE